MTPSQRSALHRIARLCVQRRDYTALDAYCEAYADRPRTPQPGGTRPMSFFCPPVRDSVTRVDEKLQPAVGWWERTARLMRWGRA